MKFAIVLAKFLCALITAAVLTAFIYYAATGTPTQLTAPVNAVSVSLMLLVVALMVWALVSMIGDIENYKIDRKTIKDVLNIRQAPSFKAVPLQSETDLSAALSAMNENNQQVVQNGLQAIMAKLNDYAAENGTASYKITSAIAALSEKLLAGTDTVNKDNVVPSADEIPANVGTALQKISTDLADLRAQTEANFAAIVSQITAQTQMIADITSVTPNTVSATTSYSHLTEEAGYPESVIGYSSPKQEQIDEPETEPEPLDEPVSVAETESDAQEDALNAGYSPEVEPESTSSGSDFEINQEDEIQAVVDTSDEIIGITKSDESDISEFISKPEEIIEPAQIQPEMSEEHDTTDIPLEEFMAAEETTEDEPAKVDLGADDPFGAPVDLNIPTEEEVATYDEPAKVDLGADDPFGAPVDLNIPAEEEVAIYDEPAKVDLGADDPFGAPATSDDNLPNPNHAPIGLRSPFDERNIIDENRVDLGADNPFGVSTDFADPFAESIAAPEDLDSLGADDPFGATTQGGTPDLSAGNFDDINLDEITKSSDKAHSEPRLDKIFNDDLASELAELEMLQDKS
jgi:hypothetical protein